MLQWPMRSGRYGRDRLPRLLCPQRRQLHRRAWLLRARLRRRRRRVWHARLPRRERDLRRRYGLLLGELSDGVSARSPRPRPAWEPVKRAAAPRCSPAAAARARMGSVDSEPARGLSVSSPCETDADCCRGQCTSQSGRKTCTATCLSNGASCGSAGDCCRGLCTGNPSVCADAQSICRVVGQTCGSADDCCTGDCVGGYCAVTCAAR